MSLKENDIVDEAQIEYRAEFVNKMSAALAKKSNVNNHEKMTLSIAGAEKLASIFGRKGMFGKDITYEQAKFNREYWRGWAACQEANDRIKENK